MGIIERQRLIPNIPPIISGSLSGRFPGTDGCQSDQRRPGRPASAGRRPSPTRRGPRRRGGRAIRRGPPWPRPPWWTAELA